LWDSFCYQNKYLASKPDITPYSFTPDQSQSCFEPELDISLIDPLLLDQSGSTTPPYDPTASTSEFGTLESLLADEIDRLKNNPISTEEVAKSYEEDLFAAFLNHDEDKKDSPYG
jgi:hypothetical protein